MGTTSNVTSRGKRSARKASTSSGGATTRGSSTAAPKRQRTSGTSSKPASAKAGPRSPLVEPLSKTLREITGGGKVTAEAVAAALATGQRGHLRRLRGLIDQALVVQDDERLDDKLWGPAPSEADTARAQRDADRARAAAVKRALSGALTRDDVAARLGISTQAVSKRTKNGYLVAVRHAGRWWYPRWQFSDDDVLSGLHELLQRFPTALALTTWATTASADLDGRTPAEMLGQRGGKEAVLDLAEAASPAAW